MTWACFTAHGPGRIVRVCEDRKMTADIYLTLLRNEAIPSGVELLGKEFMFLQDNDPKHTAHIVRDFLDDPKPLPGRQSSPQEKAVYRDLRVEVINHPAQSPDLNPIENIWRTVERRVQRRKPTTFQKLQDFVWAEWAAITPAEAEKYVHSMPERLRSVIENNGYHTKY
jgi:hypothetical protein